MTETDAEKYPLEKLQSEYLKALVNTQEVENLQRTAEELAGMPNLSRQQRRERQRAAKRYDQKTSFAKQEMEAASEVSYQYGKAFALYAAQQVLGLGDVRLDRVRLEIEALELQFFQKMSLDPLPFDIKEMNTYKGGNKK